MSAFWSPHRILLAAFLFLGSTLLCNCDISPVPNPTVGGETGEYYDEGGGPFGPATNIADEGGERDPDQDGLAPAGSEESGGGDFEDTGGGETGETTGVGGGADDTTDETAENDTKDDCDDEEDTDDGCTDEEADADTGSDVN